MIKDPMEHSPQHLPQEVSSEYPFEDERENAFALEALHERFNDLTEHFTLNENFMIKLEGLHSVPTLEAYLHEAFGKEINPQEGISLVAEYDPNSGQFAIPQLYVMFKSAKKGDSSPFARIEPHQVRGDLYQMICADPTATSMQDRIKTEIMPQEAMVATLDSLGLIIPNGVTVSSDSYEKWTRRLARYVEDGRVREVTIHEARTDFHHIMPPMPFTGGASHDIGHATIVAIRDRTFSNDTTRRAETREVLYTIAQEHHSEPDAEPKDKPFTVTEQVDALRSFTVEGEERFVAFSQTGVVRRGNEILENPGIDVHEFNATTLERFHRILMTARAEQKQMTR